MRAWPNNRAWFVSDLLHHEELLARRLMDPLIPGAPGKIARTQGRGRRTEAEVTADVAALYDALNGQLADAEWLARPRVSNADLAGRAMVNVLGCARERLALRRERRALDAWCAGGARAAPPSGRSVVTSRRR